MDLNCSSKSLTSGVFRIPPPKFIRYSFKILAIFNEYCLNQECLAFLCSSYFSELKYLCFSISFFTGYSDPLWLSLLFFPLSLVL